MFLTKLNPVEPPWYVTRMPGGVGGVAPRGVPLSRSSAQPRRCPPFRRRSLDHPICRLSPLCGASQWFGEL